MRFEGAEGSSGTWRTPRRRRAVVSVSAPVQAWQALQDGNARFVSGYGSRHERARARAADALPIAVVFGCADSPLSAELVFDQGAGAVLTVSTWGHVVGEGVLGSIEYAVAEAGVPLVVVLGHQQCGALRAAADNGCARGLSDGHARMVVEQVGLSLAADRGGWAATADVQDRHVAAMGSTLLARSTVLTHGVRAGRCAIACAMSTADGRVRLLGVLGDVGDIATLSCDDR